MSVAVGGGFVVPSASLSLSGRSSVGFSTGVAFPRRFDLGFFMVVEVLVAALVGALWEVFLVVVLVLGPVLFLDDFAFAGVV